MERRDEFLSNSLIGHTPFKQLSPFLKANEEATKTYPASRGEDKVLQNLNVHMLQTRILLETMEKHFNAKLQCLIVFLFHIKANKASRKNKKSSKFLKDK